MTDITITQVVLTVDGELCQLIIPKDRRDLALRLLQSVFDDGVLSVVRLPKDVKAMPLTEMLKEGR